jgi:hypothetical protein
MTTEVEQATKTLNDLTDARDALVARSAKLTSDRKAIAYAAHAAGDKGAKERLHKINHESVLHHAEVESLNAAISEATSRLGIAQAAEAAAADREQATQLHGHVANFKEHGLDADASLLDFVASIRAMMGELDAIHALGQQAPTAEMFRVNAVICIKTMLQSLPSSWVRDFDFSLLNPSQKRAFKDIIEVWHAQITNGIVARLGEKQEEAAA